MTLSELITKVNTFEKLYESLEGTVFFNLTVMWGALAFVVAAAGASLYFIAQRLVTKSMDSKSDKMKADIKRELQSELGFKVVSRGQFLLKSNEPLQILYASAGEVKSPYIIVTPKKGILNFNISEVTKTQFTIIATQTANTAWMEIDYVALDFG